MNITIDDSAATLQYTGEWRMQPPGDALAKEYFADTYHVTQADGASVIISFSGSALYVYGSKGPGHSNYTVRWSTDIQYLSAWADTFQPQQLLWSSNSVNAFGGNSGTQQVAIASQINGTNSWFDVDFFTITEASNATSTVDGYYSTTNTAVLGSIATATIVVGGSGEGVSVTAPKSGLSTAIIACIALGALFLLLIIGGTIFYFRRKRSRAMNYAEWGKGSVLEKGYEDPFVLPSPPPMALTHNDAISYAPFYNNPNNAINAVLTDASSEPTSGFRTPDPRQSQQSAMSWGAHPTVRIAAQVNEDTSPRRKPTLKAPRNEADSPDSIPEEEPDPFPDTAQGSSEDAVSSDRTKPPANRPTKFSRSFGHPSKAPDLPTLYLHSTDSERSLSTAERSMPANLQSFPSPTSPIPTPGFHNSPFSDDDSLNRSLLTYSSSMSFISSLTGSANTVSVSEGHSETRLLQGPSQEARDALFKIEPPSPSTRKKPKQPLPSPPIKPTRDRTSLYEGADPRRTYFLQIE